MAAMFQLGGRPSRISQALLVRNRPRIRFVRCSFRPIRTSLGWRRARQGKSSSSQGTWQSLIWYWLAKDKRYSGWDRFVDPTNTTAIFVSRTSAPSNGFLLNPGKCQSQKDFGLQCLNWAGLRKIYLNLNRDFSVGIRPFPPLLVN